MNQQGSDLIQINNLKKTYHMGDNELQVLKGVTLSIKQGEFVAIMGPSGSGKSTLMNILGLLDWPDEGEYLFRGKNIVHLDEDQLAMWRRNHIGFIFQQFHLLTRMSAQENISLPLFYSRKYHDEGKAIELLKKVGLETRGHHRPNELSGGQQQRVAIARSLVNAPSLIFADEPTGNLDSATEKEIIGLLKNLNEMGITVIIVTHEEEIGLQAKRLIRMRDGLIQSDEILEHKLNSHHKDEKAGPVGEVPRAEVPSDSFFLFRDLFEHFKQGLRTLMGNKIRTGLSMLGILIGVAAVIAVFALGKGAQEAIKQQMSSLGSNSLILRSGSPKIGGVAQETASTKLMLSDVEILKSKVKNLRGLAPTINNKGQVAYKNKNWVTQILGTTPAYANIRSAETSFGRFFSAEEVQKRARVAIVGRTVIREIMDGKNPIGEMIKINKINFQVIGVLPEKGSGGWQDQDDLIIIPVTTAMYRLFGKENIESIEIEVSDSKIMDQVIDEILKVMVHFHKVPLSMAENAFRIFNMAEIQAAAEETGKTLSLLLSSIAVISLLVGGIGIMNIMLVSVTERTKEIGLRKSLGARRNDILLQFLIESIVIGIVGGISGILLGLLVTFFLATYAGWMFAIAWDSIFLAFGFSVFIGIVFGLYPAMKASQLRPVEALRYE